MRRHCRAVSFLLCHETALLFTYNKASLQGKSAHCALRRCFVVANMRLVVAQAASTGCKHRLQAVYTQVARHQDPQQDAAKVVAVRKAVGHSIVLRADANRKWSLNQAVAFGHAVWDADLQVLAELFCVLFLAACKTGNLYRWASNVLV